MIKISIEEQYQFFLESVEIKEKDMSQDQRTQLRQTFFGAFGIFIKLMDEMADITQQEFIEAIGDMQRQVVLFFQNEILSKN